MLITILAPCVPLASLHNYHVACRVNKIGQIMFGQELVAFPVSGTIHGKDDDPQVHSSAKPET